MRITILILFIGLSMMSCMKMGGDVPSRLAITNADQESPEEITLLPGMSYKVYPVVYSSKEEGAELQMRADQADFLGKVKFSIDQDESDFLDINSKGCVMAKKIGEGDIHLSAYSLSSGAMQTKTRIKVVPMSSQAQVIRNNVREFWVSEVTAQDGKVYGLVVNDHFHMFDQTGQSLMTSSDGIQLEDNLTGLTNVTIPFLWSDPLQSGFFVAYQKKKDDKAQLSYTAIQRNGVRWPVPFNFEMEFSLLKIFGGQFRNTMPLLFSVIQNKDKDGNPSTYSFFAVTQQLLQTKVGEAASTQQGFILDSNDGGKEVEMKITLSTETDFDDVVRMVQDPSGGFTIAYGTSLIHPNPKVEDETKSVNRLKFVRIESAGASVTSVVEAPQGMDLDGPKAFAIDSRGSNPKVLFIQNGRLLFSQRLGGGWLPSFREVGQGAIADLPPKLTTDTEDGTMMAVWKSSDQKINARFSMDGGFGWLDALNLEVAPTFMDLIPFPCQGSALMTVENNVLQLRFIDETRKKFLDPLILATANGKIKKVMWFKEFEKIRVFYLVEGGELFYLSVL